MKMLHSHSEGQVQKRTVKTIVQGSALWNPDHTGTAYELKKLHLETHTHRRATKQSLPSFLESTSLTRRGMSHSLSKLTYNLFVF